MDLDLKRHRCAARLVAAGVFMLKSWPALAVDQVHDEIQVYKGDMAEVGQWSYEQHLNFAAIGQTQPEFPGGFTSNHSLQGTPEFSYGITKWWEAGFYLPFAVRRLPLQWRQNPELVRGSGSRQTQLLLRGQF